MRHPRTSGWRRWRGRRVSPTRGSSSRRSRLTLTSDSAGSRRRSRSISAATRRSRLPTASSRTACEGPIRFATRSGVLTVSQRQDGSLAMDFPGMATHRDRGKERRGRRTGCARGMDGPHRQRRLPARRSSPTSASVRDLSPDLAAVSRLDASALIVTAVADPGQGYRLRLPPVRSDSRYPRGSGHRQRAYRAGAVLGKPARTDITRRPPGVSQIRAGRR